MASHVMVMKPKAKAGISGGLSSSSVGAAVNVAMSMARPSAAPGLPAADQRYVAAVPGNELLVTDLPDGITDEDLRELFEIHGPVLSSRVTVMSTPRGKACYGVVAYQDPDGAQTAIELMDGNEVLGKVLKIQLKTVEAFDALTRQQHKQSDVPAPKAMRPLPKAATSTPLPQSLPKAEPLGRAGCELVVFNLPLEWGERELQVAFEGHGILAQAEVHRDDVVASRCFGLIRYQDRSGAVTAMRTMQGYRAGDRRLKVEVKKHDFSRQVEENLLGLQAQASIPVAAGESSAGMPALSVEVLHVKPELVGLMIGKDGQTVKFLAKESGARIEISKATENRDDARVVTLTGNARCLMRAKELIDETMKKSKEFDPNTRIVRVEHEMCGMIIGRGGETIKKIKKESGARIDISKTPSDPEHPDDRLIYISGPVECVDFAQEMIEEMINNSKESREKWEEDSKEIEFEVPEDLFGMLIGKGGEKIKAIAAKSNTRIRSTKGPQDVPSHEVVRVLHIVGTAEDVERARQMVDDRINTMHEEDAPNWEEQVEDVPEEPQQSEEKKWEKWDNDAWEKRTAPYRSGESKKTIEIDVRYIGILIGKGGNTIKEISKATSCRIEVEKETGANDSRKVHISGASEADIEKANASIQEVVADGRDRDRTRENKKGNKHEEQQVIDELEGTEGLLNEKIYIDEVDLSYRSLIWPLHEDGDPHDLEIFVKGLPLGCEEKDLWEHLCSVGARDVREILMLRRNGKSKGMAYIMFGHHDAALIAKRALDNAPILSMKCGKWPNHRPPGQMTAAFSESERCAKGISGVYQRDMAGFLLGSKGKHMEDIKQATGLKKVLMTGAQMKSFKLIDDDPRLHLIVFFTEGDSHLAQKAVECWSGQVRQFHDSVGSTFTHPRNDGMEEEDGEEDTGDVCVVLRDTASGHDRHDEVLSGFYSECGENHGRPVYRRCVEEHRRDAQEVYIYYWDGQGGTELAAWWFGAAVGGEEVWAKCYRDTQGPPDKGWQLIAQSEKGIDLLVVTHRGKETEEKQGRRKRRRRKERGQALASPQTSQVNPPQAQATNGVPTSSRDAWQPVGVQGSNGPPPPMQPPRPWKRIPHQGGHYYWNEKSGESSWYPPPGSRPIASGDGAIPHTRSRSPARAGRDDRQQCSPPGQWMASGEFAPPPGVLHPGWGPPSHGGAPLPPPPPGAWPHMPHHFHPWGMGMHPPALPGAHGHLGPPLPSNSSHSSSSDGQPLPATFCYPDAKLGDSGVRSWTVDRAAPDGGPEMLRRLGQSAIDVFDFSNNELTDVGCEVLAEFIICNRLQIKKLKLHRNRMTSLAGICRLLEDPTCGIRTQHTIRELHLSHNNISSSALELVLNSVLRSKPPGRMKKPPLWVRLENNNIIPSSLAAMLDRINRQGLKVVIIDKKDGAPNVRSQIDADVQFYFAE